MDWLKQSSARRRRYHELSELIGQHLEEKIADLMDGGMTREEAERTARRDFGTVTRIEERSREVWQWPIIESLGESVWADTKYAARQMRKSLTFSLTCVLTLALGIGANTAIFSIINTVLLHPLPYYDPSRLLLVSENLPQEGSSDVGVSAQEYLDYQHQNDVFSGVAAFETDGFNLSGTGHPERINAALISATALPLLGATPELGRNFAAEEDHYGSNHVVLLSHALWQNQYGADPSILGKTIHLDETPYTVVGVMPASFRFPLDAVPPPNAPAFGCQWRLPLLFSIPATAPWSSAWDSSDA